MFLSLLLVALLALIIYLGYAEYKSTQYFKSRGVHYLGNGYWNLLHLIVRGTPLQDNVLNMYESVKKAGAKLGGSINFGKEVYVVVDLEIIKGVLVKDFDHFVDRQKRIASTKRDEIFTRTLISVEGDTWKALRSKMSPAFTTGKIRRMFSIMDVSGKRTVEYVQERLKQLPPGGVHEIDMQEGFSKFTMDFIASAAFGIDSKAFEQPKPSMFEQMASKLQLNLGFLNILKFIIVGFWPKFADKLNLGIIPEDASKFFCSVIREAIEYRRKNSSIGEGEGGRRNDFIELMLEARAGQLKLEESELSQFEKDQQLKDGGAVQAKLKIPLEDDDIVAQCILFIVGGFDTTQGVLFMGAYNLAIHQEVQERLHNEVKEALEKNGGKLSYDLINQMEYMEMFISESLRYFAPAVATQRLCTKDYLVPGTDVLIKKDSLVNIPIYALHRDPDLYEQPDTFDPERFSTENRYKIHPYTYMPFGLGPRSCIAMRLALVEVKVAIAHLVLNFRMEPSPKTPIPMKFAKAGTLKPANGLWLKMNPRQRE